MSLLVSTLLVTVHTVTLFYCFIQVSAPGEDTYTHTHGRQLLAALLTDHADDVKTGDPEQSFFSG